MVLAEVGGVAEVEIVSSRFRKLQFSLQDEETLAEDG